MDRVIEEDPMGQMWRYGMSLTLMSLGLEDQAIEQCRKSVELDPQFWIGWFLLATYHSLHGRHAEALHCAEAAFSIAHWAPMALGVKAGALANTGRMTEAEPLLEALRSESSTGAIGLAYYSLARGDLDSAVESAGQAADQRMASLVTIFIRPFEPRLRTSPGWPALMTKLNLTPATN
jgi:tetratricopeptide (TPR) repeat protein